jgi:hypothetical protein
MGREVCNHFRPIEDFCQNCHEPDQFEIPNSEANLVNITDETLYQNMRMFNRAYNNMDGQTLKTGVKKDEGKPRFGLLPYDVLAAISRILTQGAKKYDDRNWELGIEYERVFSGVQRHLTEWWNANLNGTDGINHADGKESHIDHAITGLMFLSAYEKRAMARFDNRPIKIK